MYKIYFGERYLIIADKHTIINDTTSREVSDIRDLGEFIKEFDSFTSLKSFTLVSESPAETMEAIKRSITCIEAGGGVVINQHGDVLVIFRYGKWDLPKGKREKDEDFASCALREVSEECGITGHTIDSRITTTYHTYKIKNSFYIKHTEWFSMKYSGTLACKPQAEEDISQAIWVKPANLPTVFANTYPSVIHVLGIAMK